MEKENLCILMEINIKEIGLIIKQKELENILDQKADTTKEVGKLMSLRDLV